MFLFCLLWNDRSRILVQTILKFFKRQTPVIYPCRIKIFHHFLTRLSQTKMVGQTEILTHAKHNWRTQTNCLVPGGTSRSLSFLNLPLKSGVVYPWRPCIPVSFNINEIEVSRYFSPFFDIRTVIYHVNQVRSFEDNHTSYPFRVCSHLKVNLTSVF